MGQGQENGALVEVSEEIEKENHGKRKEVMNMKRLISRLASSGGSVIRESINGDIEIGTKFIDRRGKGKKAPVQTVIDIYTTTNSKGKVVKRVYVCSHELLGQEVVNYDVPAATIKLAERVE